MLILFYSVAPSLHSEVLNKNIDKAAVSLRGRNAPKYHFNIIFFRHHLYNYDRKMFVVPRALCLEVKFLLCVHYSFSFNLELIMTIALTEISYTNFYRTFKQTMVFELEIIT